MAAETGLSALLHCNAGLHHGMGHLMRALTLSIEAAGRGWTVELAGEFDDTARRLIADHPGVQRVHAIDRTDQPTALPRLADALSPDVIHADSYLPEADALVGPASLLSNVQDGPFGARHSDLSIDPNLDAETGTDASGWGTSHLAGIDYAFIRAQVRGVRGRWAPSSSRSRVFIVLGGTDPYRFTPRLLRAISDGHRGLDITVVAPPAVREEVEQIARQSSLRIVVTGFLSDLPATAVDHDLVVSAAGTSVWDFACMGVPTAMVCVTENQERGYDAAVAHGLAAGIQRSPHWSWEHASDEIFEILSDESQLRRLSATGMNTVDGLGAWRVVGAWESLVRTPLRHAEAGGLVSRPASIGDARTLFEWRNDPETRRMSRSTDVVVWDEHLAWLTRVIADDTRVLLVVEQDGIPIGTVRWDHRGGVEWEVSISVAPSYRGKGLASNVLAAGEQGMRTTAPRRLIAGINVANAPSRRLFAGAGYLPYAPADGRGFAEYAKLLPPIAEGLSS